jgi:hypothetical protein
MGTCSICGRIRVRLRKNTKGAECWERRRQTRQAYIKVAKTRPNRPYELRKMGMTPEQYDEMFYAQGGVCAICKQQSERALCIDHDHGCCAHGTACKDCIRGLLCNACNVGLGYFRDSPDVLRSAAEYVGAA